MKQLDSSLIVRMPNWVGDAVMALPIVQRFQKNGINLQLLGKPWLKQLLSAIELPIHTLDKGLWSNVNKMATIPADKVLLLTNSFSSAFISRLAGKEVIGYQADKRRLLLKRSLPKPAHVHEMDYFWQIARYANQYWFPELAWPDSLPQRVELPINNQSLNAARDALHKAGVHDPFWALCPFAYGHGLNNQSKIWPNWREFSQQLTEHPTVVCPGPNEEHLCSQLVPNAIVLPRLNLAEYAAVLTLASQVIANDSGPMHIAAAVNPHTLGIFGVSDPERTRPWGAHYVGAKDQWPSLDEVNAQL